jgi:DNA-binding response OmpR family regulator
MKTIVVADHDPAVRRLISRVLESAGYEVRASEVGRQAIALCNSVDPDLVVVDVDTPEVEGKSTLAHLAETDHGVPLIVVTARADKFEPAVQRRTYALMEKPLDLPLLLERIRELLNVSSQQGGFSPGIAPSSA